MTSAKTKAACSPVPLDPPVGRVTLTGYLGMVSDFWTTSGGACERCDMQIEPGYCAMLHDHAIPDGNCLGLLERDGVEQPTDMTPNAALTGGEAVRVEGTVMQKEDI